MQWSRSIAVLLLISCSVTCHSDVEIKASATVDGLTIALRYPPPSRGRILPMLSLTLRLTLHSEVLSLYGLHRRIIVSIPAGVFEVSGLPYSLTPGSRMQHSVQGGQGGAASSLPNSAVEIILRGAGPGATILRMPAGARANTVLLAHTRGPCDSVTVEVDLKPHSRILTRG